MYIDVLSKNSLDDDSDDDERSSKMELQLTAVLNEEAKAHLQEVAVSSVSHGRIENKTEHYIGRTRVTIRHGVVHSEIPVLWDMSEEIRPYVIGFLAETGIDLTRSKIVRENGKYALPGDEERKTVGLVESGGYTSNWMDITCYGPNKKKVLELYNLIRSGKIRPYENVDAPQGGKSREQLEQEVRFLSDDNGMLKSENELLESYLKQAQTSEKHAQTELEKTEAALKKAREELERSREETEFQVRAYRAACDESNRACDKNARLRLLAGSIKNESPLWPLIFRRTVAKRIYEVLNGK